MPLKSINLKTFIIRVNMLFRQGGVTVCESNVFLKKNESEEILLEDVEILRPEGDEIYLANIHGEEKRLKARLVLVNFSEHKAILSQD